MLRKINQCFVHVLPVQTRFALLSTFEMKPMYPLWNRNSSYKPFMLWGSRYFSGAVPQDQLNDEEKKHLWKEVANSQGRIYYENFISGKRTWDRPSGKMVNILRLDEVEQQAKNKRENVNVPEIKPNDGGSIIIRAFDYFWTITSIAHKAYWVGAAGVFVYIGYELIIHYFF